MKECKLCNTKAVRNSMVIDGLCCCRMCGSFFFEGKASDCSELTVGQILREVVVLSGFKDTLTTLDALHIAAQLRDIGPAILNAFTVVLKSDCTLVEQLMKFSKGTYDSIQRQKLCDFVGNRTGLSYSILAYIVDTYAYALELTDTTVEYSDQFKQTPSDILRVNEFRAEREYIKVGESTRLIWEVNAPDAVVAISDGYHQWCVPASGAMTVSPSKDKSYTLTAVKGGMSVTPEKVDIHLVKPVTIHSCKVSKTKVYEGQTVTVSWKVSGATRIELQVNDGHSYRDPEDVTRLKSKEVHLSRDSQIILTCLNDCYQAQEYLSVHVKGAPRFPLQEMICLKQLPQIDIPAPVLPLSFGQDASMVDKFRRLERSKLDFYELLEEKLAKLGKWIKNYQIFK